MTLLSRNPAAEVSYIRHLRYALATTTCRATIDLLQQMLREAEANLHKQEQNVDTSRSKPL